MDYEQKYKEALERAKLSRLQLLNIGEEATEIEYIFPELAESEDEKIRKALLEYFGEECDTATINGIYCYKIYDWLKKQNEHKSIDKVIKPKFHEGEWVVYKNDICQIVKREEGCNKLVTVFGIEKELVNERNLSTALLWTIQDAKDGDVLYSLDSNRPFIYKERNGYEQATAYCGINIYGKFFVSGTKDCVITLDKYVPATKEQRDLLFQKIKEAGYEWDAEKKELKMFEKQGENVIETIPIESNPQVVFPYCKNTNCAYVDGHWFCPDCHREFQTKWSEEDERMMNFCISRIKDELESLRNNKFAHQEILQDCKEGCWERIDWLKSIKKRIGREECIH